MLRSGPYVMNLGTISTDHWLSSLSRVSYWMVMALPLRSSMVRSAQETVTLAADRLKLGVFRVLPGELVGSQQGVVGQDSTVLGPHLEAGGRQVAARTVVGADPREGVPLGAVVLLSGPAARDGPQTLAIHAVGRVEASDTRVLGPAIACQRERARRDRGEPGHERPADTHEAVSGLAVVMKSQARG